MSEQQPLKAVGWFEINVPDKAKGLDFYSSIFGYTTSDMDMGEMGTYTMLHHGGVPFGGSMEMSGPEWEGIPPHWMTYFSVSNMDEACEKIKSAGGQVVHGPMPIPGDGLIAVCTDDQGAHFSIIWENPENAMPAGPEAIDWVEHMSPDRTKADAFYQNVFGWNKIEENMGPEVGMYSMYGTGEKFHAGAMQIGPGMPIPPNWTVYLVTQNIHDTVEKIKAKGGVIHAEPMEIPGVGHIAMAADCCGAAFGLHQPAPQQ